jgi:hypothetical protein
MHNILDQSPRKATTHKNQSNTRLKATYIP